MNRRSALAIAAVLSCVISLAGARVPVEVVDQSEDRVGGQLIYRIKEEFRSSAGFRFAGPNEPHAKLVVSTMDRYKDEKLEGASTVYAVIWLLAPGDTDDLDSYYTNSIGYAGANRVSAVALDIVARTDRLFGGWSQWK